MGAVQTIINILKSQGIFEFYLPFLLTFSIFYALLRKTKIFGETKPGPQICLIVALVAGIYVMGFTSLGNNISLFFMRFFAQSSVFLSLIVVIAMVLGALAIPMILGDNYLRDSLLKSDKAKLVLAIAAILIVFAMFLSNLIVMPGLPPISIPGISSEDIAVILLLLATLGIIVFVMSEKPSGGSS